MADQKQMDIRLHIMTRFIRTSKQVYYTCATRVSDIPLLCLSSRVSSVGTARASFTEGHGNSRVRSQPWSTAFSDIVATGSPKP